MPSSYTKDESAKLDYVVDWTAWLADGETITTSTWTVPGDLTQPTAATKTNTAATVWLGGGILGKTYQVTNHIVTSSGREDDRTLTIRVRNR